MAESLESNFRGVLQQRVLCWRTPRKLLSKLSANGKIRFYKMKPGTCFTHELKLLQIH